MSQVPAPDALPTAAVVTSDPSTTSPAVVTSDPSGTPPTDGPVAEPSADVDPSLLAAQPVDGGQ